MEALVYCPWGCGQILTQHVSNRQCPPQTGNGHWANGPDKALGATPQLQQDVKDLTEFRKSMSCSNCRHLITTRINTIENELRRRGIR